MVDLHKKIQHLELRNKYNVDFALDSPEDIQKWREERKARFPKVQDGEQRQPANNLHPENVPKQQNRNNHRNKRHNRRKRQFNKSPDNQANFKRSRLNESTSSLVETVADKSCSDKPIDKPQNSLSLISCYSSDEESGESSPKKNLDFENEQIIREMVNSMISKVHSDLSTQSSSIKQTVTNKNIKRKKPFNPHQHMAYSKLNLFQKVSIVAILTCF